ncbi:hypothetical protein ABXZ88_002054 [Vibrio fluvialis]
MSNIDLRVGEVFESELHYESEPFNDKFRFVIFQNGKAVAATWFEDQAEAICIAVNQHSNLTAITNELVSALEGLVSEVHGKSMVDAYIDRVVCSPEMAIAEKLLLTIKDQKVSN